GRARARQADDEEGVPVRMPPALPVREQLRRADRDLLPGVELDELGAIAAFGSLQLIALLVVAERVSGMTLILQGLAESEAQVVAIDERESRLGEGPLHPCLLLRCESIGLEVCKAPVGVSELRPALCGAAIGLDRLLCLSECFQGMADGEM